MHTLSELLWRELLFNMNLASHPAPPQVGRFVLAWAARVPLREGLAGGAGLLCDRVCVALPVLARVWVDVTVA